MIYVYIIVGALILLALLWFGREIYRAPLMPFEYDMDTETLTDKRDKR